MTNSTPFLYWAAQLSFGLIGLGYVFSFLRLARGPTLPDRVVALDLIAALTLGWVSIYTLLTEQPVYLDLAVIMALITFLGTVALALYLEKKVDK